jgi:hypothetical protein
MFPPHAIATPISLVVETVLIFVVASGPDRQVGCLRQGVTAQEVVLEQTTCLEQSNCISEIDAAAEVFPSGTEDWLPGGG